MSDTRIISGIDFGKTLEPFEKKWVALDDATNTPIANGDSIEDLKLSLTEEQKKKDLRFMKVLPHDSIFASTSYEI